MTSRTNHHHSPKRTQKPSLSPNFSDFVALSPDRKKAHSPVSVGGRHSPGGGKHSPNNGGNKTKRENKSLSPKFLRGKLSSIPAPHSPLHHNSSGKLRWNPEPAETPYEIFAACPIDDLKEQEIQILRAPEAAGPPHRRQILLNGVAVGFLERHSHHHKNPEGTEAHDSHEGHATEDHSDHSSAASDADCELTNRWTVTNPSGEAVVRIAEKAVHSEDERTLPPHLRQPKHPKALRVYTTRPIYRGQLASSKIPCGLPGKRQHLYHAADLRAKPAGILGNQVARQLRVHLSDGKREKRSLVTNRRTGELSVVRDDEHHHSAEPCAHRCPETSSETCDCVKVMPGNDPLLVALFLVIGKDL